MMGPKGRKFSVSNFFGFGGSKEDSKSKPNLTKAATFTATSAAHVEAFREDAKIQPQTVMQLPSSSAESQSLTDTPPELQQVLAALSSASGRLYNEGHLHILDDTDTTGKPLPGPRTWTECFAQLVGTQMSLWDARELAESGSTESVPPRYLNLADSSMKMIRELPTRDGRGPPLLNVLSISTAGKNRLLLHFDTFHALAQWTAAIRLAMFDNATLSEAYTGCLLAGKGKPLSSTKEILARTSSTTELWVQVRFASGEVWEKVWCMICPPDEKAFQKRKKMMQKELESGNGNIIPYLTGEIKFYRTNKNKKKQTPLAVVRSAYACYAIFPERKEMIEHSSLIKLEGTIEFFEPGANVVEGDVFIWPDSHQNVANMEQMVRWLMRAYDALGLYGRPGRLIADCSDPRSIMFAMANDGGNSLDIQDVANTLINEFGPSTTEAEIRQRLKELKKQRMIRPRKRNSVMYPHRASNMAFEDGRSSESSSPAYQQGDYGLNSAARSTPSVYRQMRPTSMVETGPKTDTGPNKKFHRFSQQPLSSNQGGFTTGFQSLALEGSEEDEDEELFPSAVRPNLDLPKDIPTTPAMENAPNSRPAKLPTNITVPPQRRISVNTLTTMGVDKALAGHGSDPAQSDGYFPPQINGSNRPAERKSLTLQTPLAPGGHRRALYTPPLLDQISGPRSSVSTSPDSVEPIRAYNNAADSGNLPSPTPVRPTETSHVVEDVEAAAKRVSLPPPLPQLPASLDDSFTDNFEDNLFAWVKKADSKPQQPLNGPISTPVPAKVPLQVQTDKTPAGRENVHSPVQPEYEEEDEPVDKELLNMIRNADQLQRVPTNSDAASVRTYNTVTSDDYASTIDSNEGKPPARREIGARFGVLKTVGTLPPLITPQSDVVIGDAHFRPSSTEEQPKQGSSVDIPKVDFGKTISHVRTLSAETIGPNYTQGNANRVTSYANMHGFGNEVQRKKSPGAVDSKRTSAYSNGSGSKESQRRSPGPGVLDSSKRNSSYGPTTPQEHRGSTFLARPKDANLRKASDDSSGGNNTNSSRSSDSASQQNRRSMAWAPGLVQTSSPRPQNDRAQSAEQYVKDKAAEAQAQSRQRYHRRLSTNALATPSNASQNGSALPVHSPPPRPRSRGGNSAFIPNGLVSQSQDLTSHLSAREQEFIARQTGSSLVQVNTQKQPPHQAGLLGMLETREGEKARMKNANWIGGTADPATLKNATLNQALAQRESLRQQQEQQTLIQEQERRTQQHQLQQQQLRQSMMSQQDLYSNRVASPGPIVDPRQSYQAGSRTPSSHSLLGRVQSSDQLSQMQYAHQTTYQPQHVTQYQQYHQAQQRSSVYGAPNQRQSMLPGQFNIEQQQQQLAIQQRQFQISQLQQQLLQEQMQAATVPVMPMQNPMVNMSAQQIGYQPQGYQPVQTLQPYQIPQGYIPPQSPPPQQFSQYGGR
ncbi:hypothetical protein BJ508DRAFT_122297 [Ascobolus immersus RN42]|uniref:PH domain-containing protein n=1 Tax=Ascobolus immersus RN42 TaxID=1160509 RepID=A0A3N4IM34_ASCIM|nr:hypothetical protein BJ508DRAFT_122297 [Ascobolus immersus RN42]